MKFERLDLVEVVGKRVIVTGYHPHRPANCYSGVIERGKGKEYVFGPKHNPIKIGTVSADHPALKMLDIRNEQLSERRAARAEWEAEWRIAQAEGRQR